MAAGQLQESEFSIHDEFYSVCTKSKDEIQKKLPIDYSCGCIKNFKACELTGNGIIPTVNRVYDFGRVVFIISGIEAYVLE
jgi:hypothetical protein